MYPMVEKELDLSGARYVKCNTQKQKPDSEKNMGAKESRKHVEVATKEASVIDPIPIGKANESLSLQLLI